MSALTLWLDNYDDIYSDFDSRHYLKRRVSEDFLYELKIALKHKAEYTSDLILLVPEEKRNESDEKIIIESLKHFFETQFLIQNITFNKKFKNGIFLLIIGIILMSAAAFLSINKINSFWSIIPKVVLEPGGWFLLWLALDFLVYDLKIIKQERHFFKELNQMSIHFQSS